MPTAHSNYNLHDGGAHAAFQFVAVLATTLFTGAAIYINIAEHPARMECGTAVAVAVFGPSYRRAAVMQVILALAGTIGGAGAWFAGGSLGWLVGAMLIFTVIPFTLIGVRPTNSRLLDPAMDRTSTEAHRLLRRWGWLHTVRSILALTSSIVLLTSLV